MLKSEKEKLLDSLRYLKEGLEELTLEPSEYILLGELLEWYRQQEVNMLKSEKAQLLESLRYLKDGLEELTLEPSEYILLGELLEWYRRHKEKAHTK